MSRILLRLLAAVFATVVGMSCTAESRKARFLEHADGYFKAGDLDKARIEYFNVLRLDPRNATAIQRLGFIWYEEGAPLRALAFLRTAREHTPADLETRTKLASAYMSVGQTTEARKEALALLQQSPTLGEALILLADTTRTENEIAETEAQLRTFPQRETVSFELASAKIFLIKRDLAATVAALQRALTHDPKSSAAHLAMGAFHALRDDREKARLEFKAASDLAPTRSPARLKFAEFTMQTGAADEAKTLLHDMTRQAPDYLPAWSLLARVALAEKKPDEALALLGNVFARDPDYLDARVLQNQALLAKGEVKKAIQAMETLDKTYANSPAIRYQLARAHLLDNNLAQAATLLNQAVALNPDYQEAILLLGEVNLRAGDPAPVEIAMQQLLQRHPNSQPAQLILADAYRAQGKLDNAAALFQAQIGARPKEIEAYLRLATVFREQKKITEAREALATAQELAPTSPAVTYQSVELDMQSADPAAALRRIELLLERTPNDAHAHLLKGRIHAMRREWDLAEAALLKALALDSKSAGATELLVGIYIEANRLPQALQRLEELLAANPVNSSALLLAAMNYEKTGAIPQARDAYEKLLVLVPESTAALNNLAYLYSERLNQLDKAQALARKARTLQPTDGSVADTLGWILYKQADYEQALSLLVESAGKLPNQPEIQYHLGMAHYMMGHADAARQAWQEAAKATMDFTGKSELQRRLSLLEETGGKSIVDLEALLEGQPGDPVMQMKLAEAYETQGSAAKAAEACEQALKVNPKLLSAVVKLAQLNAGPLNKPEKALESARKARALAPSDPKVAAVVGAIAYRSGSGEWAYNLLHDSARDLPKDTAVLRDYAWAAYGLGKTAEAREIMQRIGLSGAAPAEKDDAINFLAMTEVNPPADAAVAELLKADASHEPALMARAARELQRGETKAAAGTYSEVLRTHPDFPLAQMRLAALWADDPQTRAAAYDMAVKARKLLTDDPELARILAGLHYHKGEFGAARQLFEESAEKRPLEASSLYYLGMARLQTRQKAEGLAALQQALDAGLGEPLATDAKRTLSTK